MSSVHYFCFVLWNNLRCIGLGIGAKREEATTGDLQQAGAGTGRLGPEEWRER